MPRQTKNGLLKRKEIVCFILVLTLVLSLTACGIENRTSDNVGDTGLPDGSTSESTPSSSNKPKADAVPRLPADYPADLVPVMDGAENIEVLPGMSYIFCSYIIHDKVENIASFHNELFASELDFVDTSTDEMYSIAFSKDGNGITIAAEPDASKDGYALVSVTISQDQRN